MSEQERVSAVIPVYNEEAVRRLKIRPTVLIYCGPRTATTNDRDLVRP